MSNIFPKYILSCKNVTYHEDDDTVSYEHAFENITVLDIPSEINFYLVLGIEYMIPKKGNRKIHIKIMDPNNKRISENDFVIELQPALKNQLRFSLNIIDVSRFKIDSEGIYSILVQHNGEILTRHDFMVERGTNNDPTNNNKASVSI